MTVWLLNYSHFSRVLMTQKKLMTVCKQHEMLMICDTFDNK